WNSHPNARCVRENRRLHTVRQLPSHHVKDAGFERGRISKSF
ncbi:MAG: hypothetical protein ACI8UR_001279, partial [Natronomonas sp.]